MQTMLLPPPDLPLPPLPPLAVSLGKMPSPLPVLTIDRTALELFWSCPRRYYWARRFLAPGAQFRGLQAASAEYRMFGKALHLMIELTVKGWSTPSTFDSGVIAGQVVDTVLQQTSDLPEVIRLELAFLITGMTVLFAERVLPSLMQHYDVLAVEEELAADYAGPSAVLRVVVKPDLVLRRKVDGKIFYWEWKSTGWSFDDDLTARWDVAPQVQIGMTAIQQAYKQCDGAFVGLFYKGQRRYNYRASPFCYGYTKGSQLSAKWRSGWTREPLASLFMVHDLTMSQWIAMMDAEVLDKQYWTTGLLTPSPYVQENLAIQLPSLIPALVQTDMNRFNQHFSMCRPALSDACEFDQACHSPVGINPLLVYHPRVPHHASEPPVA